MSHLSSNTIFEDSLYNEKSIHQVEFFMPSPEINSKIKDPINVSFNDNF